MEHTWVLMVDGTVVRTRTTCSSFSIGVSSVEDSPSPKTAAQRPLTPWGRKSCWLRNVEHVLRACGTGVGEEERMPPIADIV